MQLVELYSSKQLREKSHTGESGDKDGHDKVTSTFCNVWVGTTLHLAYTSQANRPV